MNKWSMIGAQYKKPKRKKKKRDKPLAFIRSGEFQSIPPQPWIPGFVDSSLGKNEDWTGEDDGSVFLKFDPIKLKETRDKWEQIIDEHFSEHDRHQAIDYAILLIVRDVMVYLGQKLSKIDMPKTINLVFNWHSRTTPSVESGYASTNIQESVRWIINKYDTVRYNGTTDKSCKAYRMLTKNWVHGSSYEVSVHYNIFDKSLTELLGRLDSENERRIRRLSLEVRPRNGKSIGDPNCEASIIAHAVVDRFSKGQLRVRMVLLTIDLDEDRFLLRGRPIHFTNDEYFIEKIREKMASVYAGETVTTGG